MHGRCCCCCGRCCLVELAQCTHGVIGYSLLPLLPLLLLLLLLLLLGQWRRCLSRHAAQVGRHACRCRHLEVCLSTNGRTKQEAATSGLPCNASRQAQVKHNMDPLWTRLNQRDFMDPK